VQDRCGVEPRVAGCGKTCCLPALGDDFGDQGFPDAPLAVGARRDQQRRIVGIDGVEMTAHRDHAGEQRHRRLDMDGAGLAIPIAQSIDSATLCNCDRPILVPA
jgi:hypothetical protein